MYRLEAIGCIGCGGCIGFRYDANERDYEDAKADAIELVESAMHLQAGMIEAQHR